MQAWRVGQRAEFRIADYGNVLERGTDLFGELCEHGEITQEIENSCRDWERNAVTPGGDQEAAVSLQLFSTEALAGHRVPLLCSR